MCSVHSLECWNPFYVVSQEFAGTAPGVPPEQAFSRRAELAQRGSLRSDEVLFPHPGGEQAATNINALKQKCKNIVQEDLLVDKAFSQTQVAS